MEPTPQESAPGRMVDGFVAMTPHEGSIEARPCLMCGFSHRYQYPNGSDASRHKADPMACINTLVPALADREKEIQRLTGALNDYAEQPCAFGFTVAFGVKQPCAENGREDPDRMCRPCWAKGVLS